MTLTPTRRAEIRAKAAAYATSWPTSDSERRLADDARALLAALEEAEAHAAAQLRTIQAQGRCVERLREEIAAMRTDCDVLGAALETAERERDEARAHAEELRQALIRLLPGHYRDALPSVEEFLVEKRAEAEREDNGPWPAALIRYRNHRGDIAWRHIVIEHLWHGKTEWHPQPQWLLRAWDVEKDAERDFALCDVQEWREVEERASSAGERAP